MNVYYEKKTEPLTYFEQGALSPLPHLHNEIEIIYVKEGEANAYADSTVYNLRKGDIFIAFPNQIQSLRRPKAQFGRQALHVDKGR